MIEPVGILVYGDEAADFDVSGKADNSLIWWLTKEFYPPFTDDDMTEVRSLIHSNPDYFMVDGWSDGDGE